MNDNQSINLAHGVRRRKNQMYKWNTMLVAPALLWATLMVGSKAIAAEPTVTVKEAETTQTSQLKATEPKADLKHETLANKSTDVVVPATTAPTVIAQNTVSDTVSNSQVLDQINRYIKEANTRNGSMGQVTSVSQLRDVRPTDWAFEALRSLVERYGCIAGYPDGTYRGQRAMTRYEFAAGMNACLLQIERLIAASTADLVTKADLAIIQRLMEEFAAELATLRTRVDNLDGRVTFLEENQFSTTTKLRGEAIIAITDSFDRDRSRSARSIYSPLASPVNSIFQRNFFRPSDMGNALFRRGALTPSAAVITANRRAAALVGTSLPGVPTGVAGQPAGVPAVPGDTASVASALGNDFPIDVRNRNDGNNTVLGDRVRLEFNTSFTGSDRLVTRLAAGNLTAFRNRGGTAPIGAGGGDFGTYEDTQTFNLAPGVNNNVGVDWLAYYTNIKGVRVFLAGAGGNHYDYVNTLNPYFQDFDGGNGALSAFATQSPIYRIGGGAGASLSYDFNLVPFLGPSSISVGYLSGSANNPARDNGVFNGDYGGLAQINFNPSKSFGFGFTYVNGYHNAGNAIFGSGGLTGQTGSFAANHPGSLLSLAANRLNTIAPGTIPTTAGATTTTPGRALFPERPMSTNSYGIQMAFRPASWLSISGFGSLTKARVINSGDGTIWSYGLGLAFPDLGKQGNVLGIFGGAQPYLSYARLDGARFREGGVPWHVEGFYKYQVSDNISITPGVIWLLNPNQMSIGNSVVGTVRTTFTF